MWQPAVTGSAPEIGGRRGSEEENFETARVPWAYGGGDQRDDRTNITLHKQEVDQKATTGAAGGYDNSVDGPCRTESIGTWSEVNDLIKYIRWGLVGTPLADWTISPGVYADRLGSVVLDILAVLELDWVSSGERVYYSSNGSVVRSSGGQANEAFTSFTQMAVGVSGENSPDDNVCILVSKDALYRDPLALASLLGRNAAVYSVGLGTSSSRISITIAVNPPDVKSVFSTLGAIGVCGKIANTFSTDGNGDGAGGYKSLAWLLDVCTQRSVRMLLNRLSTMEPVEDEVRRVILPIDLGPYIKGWSANLQLYHRRALPATGFWTVCDCSRVRDLENETRAALLDGGVTSQHIHSAPTSSYPCEDGTRKHIVKENAAGRHRYGGGYEVTTWITGMNNKVLIEAVLSFPLAWGPCETNRPGSAEEAKPKNKWASSPIEGHFMRSALQRIRASGSSTYIVPFEITAYDFPLLDDHLTPRVVTESLATITKRSRGDAKHVCTLTRRQRPRTEREVAVMSAEPAAFASEIARGHRYERWHAFGAGEGPQPGSELGMHLTHYSFQSAPLLTAGELTHIAGAQRTLGCTSMLRISLFLAVILAVKAIADPPYNILFWIALLSIVTGVLHHDMLPVETMLRVMTLEWRDRGEVEWRERHKSLYLLVMFVVVIIIVRFTVYTTTASWSLVTVVSYAIYMPACSYVAACWTVIVIAAAGRVYAKASVSSVTCLWCLLDNRVFRWCAARMWPILAMEGLRGCMIPGAALDCDSRKRPTASMFWNLGGAFHAPDEADSLVHTRACHTDVIVSGITCEGTLDNDGDATGAGCGQIAGIGASAMRPEGLPASQLSCLPGQPQGAPASRETRQYVSAVGERGKPSLSVQPCRRSANHEFGMASGPRYNLTREYEKPDYAASLDCLTRHLNGENERTHQVGNSRQKSTGGQGTPNSASRLHNIQPPHQSDTSDWAYDPVGSLGLCRMASRRLPGTTFGVEATYAHQQRNEGRTKFLECMYELLRVHEEELAPAIAKARRSRHSDSELLRLKKEVEETLQIVELVIGAFVECGEKPDQDLGRARLQLLAIQNRVSSGNERRANEGPVASGQRPGECCSAPRLETRVAAGQLPRNNDANVISLSDDLDPVGGCPPVTGSRSMGSVSEASVSHIGSCLKVGNRRMQRRLRRHGPPPLPTAATCETKCPDTMHDASSIGKLPQKILLARVLWEQHRLRTHSPLQLRHPGDELSGVNVIDDIELDPGP